jgi:transposase
MPASCSAGSRVLREQGMGAGKRHELTDAAWAVVGPLLPPAPKRRRGRPWREHRAVLNGILFVLATGVPWRDAPERYGPWQTLYERFARWSDDGTLDRVLRALLREMNARGAIDWGLWCVDGTSIRALKAAAGARGKNPAHARGRPPARARRPRPGAFPGWLG